MKKLIPGILYLLIAIWTCSYIDSLIPSSHWSYWPLELTYFIILAIGVMLLIKGARGYTLNEIYNKSKWLECKIATEEGEDKLPPWLFRLESLLLCAGMKAEQCLEIVESYERYLNKHYHIIPRNRKN